MALSDDNQAERDQPESTISQSSQPQTNPQSSESVPPELVNLLLEMMGLNKTEQPSLNTAESQPETLSLLEQTVNQSPTSQTLQIDSEKTDDLGESGNSETKAKTLAEDESFTPPEKQAEISHFLDFLMPTLSESENSVTQSIKTENDSAAELSPLQASIPTESDSAAELSPTQASIPLESDSTEELSKTENLISTENNALENLENSAPSTEINPAESPDLANSVETLANLLFSPQTPSYPLPEKSDPPNEQEALTTEIEAELRGKLTQIPAKDATAIVVTEEDTDLLTPFEQLQNLLVGDNLNEVRHIITNLDQKLSRIHHQLYDPKELLELLLPLIAELLSRKVSESKEEVSRAIVPIIDQVILERAHEDKQAMSEALASVIPPAISKQINDNPEEIANAIGPTMGKAIKEQIRVEKDAMVDALYPVIGNTVAKYLAEAIRSINDKISNAFSVEGITRKVRARVQGVSEGELIFRESIPFTVQAIFLIHKASGLVIAEVQNPGGYRLESEMVAGMLTAIRSFVNECIVRPGEVSELNEIEYGDSKIILEVAGYCYQAVVIQGEPTKRFIQKMRQTLSGIILKYGQPIEKFDGDPSQVPDAIPTMLEALIQAVEKEKEPEKKPPAALLGLSALVLSLILIPWGFFQYRQSVERRIEKETAIALGSAPELAVYRLEVDATGKTLILTGKLPNNYLRAKAAEIAQSTVPNFALENRIIAVDVPPDPVLVAAEVKRVESVLNELNSFSISAQYEAGKVSTTGKVFEWEDAEKITAAFERIPGVKSVVNTLELKPLEISARIYFDSGSFELRSEERSKLSAIKTLLDRHPEIKLQIIGHSDSLGNPVKNQQLALKRAEAVREGLVTLGISNQRLQVIGVNEPPADVDKNQPLWMSRCVKFEPMTQISPNK